jgi:hypothetical protein
MFFGTAFLRPAFVCAIIKDDPAVAVLEIPATPICRGTELVLRFAGTDLCEQMVHFLASFIARIDWKVHNRLVLNARKPLLESLLTCGLANEALHLSDIFDALLVAFVGRIVHIVVEPDEDQTCESLLVRAMQLTHLFEELLTPRIPIGVCEVGGNSANLLFHGYLLFDVLSVGAGDTVF